MNGSRKPRTSGKTGGSLANQMGQRDKSASRLEV
jgi:hypothetical protein